MSVTQFTDAELTTALNKAKIGMAGSPDSVFISTICFSMKHIWDHTIPTACVDGLEIRFNPSFFMELTVAERLFLLLHETWHVAFMHMLRRNARKHKRWNIACDHLINLMLIEKGYTMPKGGFADPQYKDLSSDAIYDLLEEAKCESSTVPMDLQEPGESDDPVQTHQDVQDVLIRATMQSKASNESIGAIPGEIQIYLNGLLNPKLRWNVLLQRYFQARVKNDYSMSKPNRRFFPKYHLPSLNSTGLINIAIAVDASGSVSDEEFKQIVSETDSILRRLKPERITLVQFDTDIHSVDVVKSVRDLMSITFTGRGGTAISPVIDWANTNKPQLLLVFTDGHFHFYAKDQTKVDVLWIVHNNNQFNPPYGKTIHYEM